MKKDFLLGTTGLSKLNDKAEPGPKALDPQEEFPYVLDPNLRFPRSLEMLEGAMVAIMEEGYGMRPDMILIGQTIEEDNLAAIEFDILDCQSTDPEENAVQTRMEQTLRFVLSDMQAMNTNSSIIIDPENGGVYVADRMALADLLEEMAEQMGLWTLDDAMEMYSERHLEYRWVAERFKNRSAVAQKELAGSEHATMHEALAFLKPGTQYPDRQAYYSALYNADRAHIPVSFDALRAEIRKEDNIPEPVLRVPSPGLKEEFFERAANISEKREYIPANPAKDQAVAASTILGKLGEACKTMLLENYGMQGVETHASRVSQNNQDVRVSIIPPENDLSAPSTISKFVEDLLNHSAEEDSVRAAKSGNYEFEDVIRGNCSHLIGAFRGLEAQSRNQTVRKLVDEADAMQTRFENPLPAYKLN